MIALSHSYNILDYCNSFLTSPFDSKACLPNQKYWLLSDVFQKYFLVISLLKIISESSLSENICNMCLVLSHHCPQIQLFHGPLLKIAWVWTRWIWVSDSTLTRATCTLCAPVPHLSNGDDNNCTHLQGLLWEWVNESMYTLRVVSGMQWVLTTCQRWLTLLCPDCVLAVRGWRVSLFLHIQWPFLFKDGVRWFIFMKSVWWLKLNVML